MATLSFRDACVALIAAVLFQSLAAMARAQVPAHADDLSGIWISYFPANPDPADLKETMARYRAMPDYRPGWAEKVAETWAKSGRGEKIFDAQSDCYPPGMANWFQFIYPTEILMTPGQVTINAEYFNQTRRVFTDGSPHPAPEDLDPTFVGYSIGRWEAKTLVVETIGLRNTLVSDIRPHSEQLTLDERIRKTGPDELEWVVTMHDPIAFKAPFTLTIRLHRAPAGERIREMVCQENRRLETFAPPQPPAN